ncbi:hypothetical protein Vretifemale_4610 [Volvox reticuliferus]|nr:hypothetical protein Vretifemale_4610 [Volvox reticuliferus]
MVPPTLADYPPSAPFGPGGPPDPFNPCPVPGRPATLTTYRCAAGWEVKGTLLLSQPTGTYTPAQCEALCVADAKCQFYVSYLDGKCSLRADPWVADQYRSAPSSIVNITCSKPGATQPLRFPQSYQTCFCQWGYCYGIANCVEGFEAYGQWGFFSSQNPNAFADMGMCMVGCQANPHLCSYALWYQNGTDVLCLARQIPFVYPTASPDYYNVQGITGPSKRANIMCEVLNLGTMGLDAGRPNP